MKVSQQIHGKNGIANIDLPPIRRRIEEKNGVDFYIESAYKYQGSLLIVPTGPLTNLAETIQKDSTIIDLIGHITFMGGALTVVGLSLKLISTKIL